MQPAELHALIAALVQSEEDPGPLLRAAIKLQLVHEALRTPPDWTKNVQSVDIMMPSSESDKQHIALPECNLDLSFANKAVQGESESVHYIRRGT